MREAATVGWSVAAARVCVCVALTVSLAAPSPLSPGSPRCRTPVVCAPSSGSCKVRVAASQLEAGDHAPPGAPAGERHGVVFICVGGCTSKAPCSPALAPASGASCRPCVTAYEVAVCGAGSGGCRVEHCGTPFVCCVYALRPHSHRVPCPPPPARSPCSLPPPDLSVCIQ